MKQIIYFLYVSAICLALTGCQKNNDQKEVISNSPKSNATENKKELKNGNRIVFQLTEGVTLDAVVEMAETNLDAVGLYHVIADKFDGKKLITALLGSMPENVELEEGQNTGRSYHYQGNLGDNFENQKGFLLAGEDAYIATEHWDKISDCFPIEYVGNEIQIIIDSESKDDEFSFASHKDASDFAGQYIKKIAGFEDVHMYQSYSFSYQQMEKMHKQAITLPENELAKPVEEVRKWNDNDNCYWMFFEQIIGGIPVLSNAVTRQDDLYIPASRTEVGYTKNGIEYIRFGRSYEILDKKTVKIVSAPDIYETLRQKFEIAIVNDIIIDQMKLIYYPLPFKKNKEQQWECDMIPTWQFRIRENESTDYIYINAVDNIEIVG